MGSPPEGEVFRSQGAAKNFGIVCYSTDTTVNAAFGAHDQQSQTLTPK